MYVVIITSFLALVLSYLDSQGKVAGGMKWGFIIVTIVGAIHYDYGNDYMSYYSLYLDVANGGFNLEALLAGEVYRDPGWAFINYIFKYLGGFFVLVAVLNIIQNTIIYRFIQREVPHIWQPLAVFIYLFTTSYYLMSFTMMRQWFVVCVFLGLWKYIKEKKWILPFIVLYLCHFIHGSSIVLLPFAFWGFVPIKNGKIYAIVFAAFIIALWISGSWVNDLFENVIAVTETESFLDRYENSDDKAGTFGIGALIQFIPLLLGIYYLNTSDKDPEDKKQIVLLSLLGFAITPFQYILPAIGRLNVYFSIFQLSAAPILYGQIKNTGLKAMLLGLFILIIVYNYLTFFSSSIWTLHYSTYHTIFSVL